MAQQFQVLQEFAKLRADFHAVQGDDAERQQVSARTGDSKYVSFPPLVQVARILSPPVRVLDHRPLVEDLCELQVALTVCAIRSTAASIICVKDQLEIHTDSVDAQVLARCFTKTPSTRNCRRCFGSEHHSVADDVGWWVRKHRL